MALATTPMFPKKATLERMRWAGLDPDDFALVTTYEDYHFANSKSPKSSTRRLRLAAV